MSECTEHFVKVLQDAGGKILKQQSASGLEHDLLSRYTSAFVQDRCYSSLLWWSFWTQRNSSGEPSSIGVQLAGNELFSNDQRNWQKQQK